MSAYKTAIIRLGESEYKRLREAEEELRLIHLSQSDQSMVSMDQNESIFKRMMADQEKRQETFNSMVSMVDQELYDLEKDTSQYVRSQIESLQNDLLDFESIKFEQTNRNLNAWVDQVNSEIVAHQQALDAYLNRINGSLAKYDTRWQAYTEEAQKWIEISNNCFELIFQNYPLDSRNANYLEFQRELLNQAIQEFNNGFVELACSAAYQVFSTISQTRIQLEAEQALKTALYQSILSQANLLLENVVNQQQIKAMDRDGNELTETIDVNFWTEGEYQVFLVSLSKFVQNLKERSDYSMDELKTDKVKLHDFSDRSIELVTQARVAILSSQLRFNIAQIVVGALESQGFFLESASYQQKDYRGSFTASTRNFSGNEVVVTVDPTTNIEDGGILNILSMDADELTEHELLQRNEEILNAIQGQGLLIGNIQSEPLPVQVKNASENRELIKTSRLPLVKENNQHGRR